MSLFPAYSTGSEQKEIVTWSLDEKEDNNGSETVSAAVECILLASDSESDHNEEPPAKRKLPVPPIENQDFYLDTKMDNGNLRVSTLYYPGRPEYKERKTHYTLGLRSSFKGKAPPRYFSTAVPLPDDTADIAARTEAMQQMLADNPRDLALWLRLIRMQESWVNVEAAKSVAEVACSHLPRCLSLHSLRLELMTHSLSNNDCMDALKKELATVKSPRLRLLLWQHLIMVSAKSTEGAGAARGAAGLALADLTQRQFAPILLFTYGSFLSVADLWEQLVQLIELSLALTFPPSPHFPPQLPEYDETKLEEYEDMVISGGLPLGVTWYRIERARAAAHWRPLTDNTTNVDPQRAPLTQDTADLLPPIVRVEHAAWLCLTVLRLAKVPALGPYGVGAAPPSAGSSSVVAALCSAPRLPPTHVARPRSAADAARVLAMFLDPPHCFADDDFGFKTWVDGLFSACISWMSELRRVAMIAWRLRWLRANAVVANAEQLRRLRNEARKLLKGEDHPLLFAELARFEIVTGEEAASKAGRAAHVAAHAAYKLLQLQQQLQQQQQHHAAHAHAIYCARVLCEVLSHNKKSATLPPEGMKALISAVLRKQVENVDAEVLQEARDTCESVCDEISEKLLTESEDLLDNIEEPFPDITDVLLPNNAEWACARVMLATDRRMEEIFKLLLDTPQMHDTGVGSEQCASFGAATAETLCERKPQFARILHYLYPNSAYIQLLNTEVRVWSGIQQYSDVKWSSVKVASEVAAIAKIMPILLQYSHDPNTAMCMSARRVSGAACERVAWWLRARTALQLARAIDALPHDKWLLVTAASRGCDAADIQALLLERLLRLRVLLDELRPIA